MRLSSVVLGSFVAILATTAGCKVSVETKTRYTEANYMLEDTADWNGEFIDIQIEGVGVSVNGGVKVTTDPARTKVALNARLLAQAFEKADADLSIADVKAGLKITREGGKIRVFCPHGGTHGDSSAGESGCEEINIVLPAGTAERKLSSKVLSGNGGLTLEYATATIGELLANSAGADSSITAQLPATQGGTISLVSDESDDLTVSLPSNFAADRVELVAGTGKVQLGPFTDIVSGSGRGAAGTGLASLKLTSKQFGSDPNDTGEIILTGR